MGKSEIRAELIRFCDSIRNYEHESGHSIYQDERESSELVDIFIALPNYLLDQNKDNSHSPTEPVIEDSSGTEFDTLQEGDWFVGTEEEYRKVFELELKGNPGYQIAKWVESALKSGFCIFVEKGFYTSLSHIKKTQLTAPEFIRRAENTFKTK